MDQASPPLVRPDDRISYAQNHEDILLDRLFRGRRGTFVDIGANHPVRDNNTYFFYRRGWRGYNLEPIEALARLFRELRPEDTTLAVAASDQEGTLTLYEVAGTDGLSTVHADIADVYRRNGCQVIERQVPARTLASLIEQYRIPAPDLLCIDVEGHEEQVLRGIPLATWQPQVVVVESTLPNTNVSSHASWEPILLDNGYLFATFNGINRFYLRGDLQEKQSCFALPVNCLDAFRTRETVEFENAIAALNGRVAEVEAARQAERALFEEFWADLQNHAAQAEHVRQGEHALLDELRADLHHQAAQIADLHQAEHAVFEAFRAELQNQLAQVDAARQAEHALFAEFRAELQNQAAQAENLRLAEHALLEELRGVYQSQLAQAEAARARWEQEQAEWTARAELLQARQQELEALVREYEDRLRQREQDLEDLPKLQARLGQLAGHEDELHRFREVVERTLPPEAVLAVVSEGDDRLLHLGGRTAWHFPRTPDGAYAGYPANSAEAIAALETIREQGARYLIVPAARLGWLDLYPEFRQFLESRFEPVPDAGPPGALRNFAARAVRKSRRLWRRFRGQPGGQAIPGSPCRIFDLWDLKRAPEEADGGKREAPG